MTERCVCGYSRDEHLSDERCPQGFNPVTMGHFMPAQRKAKTWTVQNLFDQEGNAA